MNNRKPFCLCCFFKVKFHFCYIFLNHNVLVVTSENSIFCMEDQLKKTKKTKNQQQQNKTNKQKQTNKNKKPATTTTKTTSSILLQYFPFFWLCCKFCCVDLHDYVYFCMGNYVLNILLCINNSNNIALLKHTCSWNSCFKCGSMWLSG